MERKGEEEKVGGRNTQSLNRKLLRSKSPSEIVCDTYQKAREKLWALEEQTYHAKEAKCEKSRKTGNKKNKETNEPAHRDVVKVCISVAPFALCLLHLSCNLFLTTFTQQIFFNTALTSQQTFASRCLSLFHEMHLYFTLTNSRLMMCFSSFFFLFVILQNGR